MVDFTQIPKIIPSIFKLGNGYKFKHHTINVIVNHEWEETILEKMFLTFASPKHGWTKFDNMFNNDDYSVQFNFI